MTARGYTVDVDALAELAEAMQRYLESGTEGLAEAERICSLIGQCWDGAASAAYQERHDRWQRTLTEMTDAVTEFKAWSSEAAAVYREVMAMNVRMAGG